MAPFCPKKHQEASFGFPSPQKKLPNPFNLHIKIISPHSIIPSFPNDMTPAKLWFADILPIVNMVARMAKVTAAVGAPSERGRYKYNSIPDYRSEDEEETVRRESLLIRHLRNPKSRRRKRNRLIMLAFFSGFLILVVWATLWVRYFFRWWNLGGYLFLRFSLFIHGLGSCFDLSEVFAWKSPRTMRLWETIYLRGVFYE